MSEINDQNRLIAEFMGLSKCTDPKHADDPCYFASAYGYQKAHEIPYRSSWDWLMPVVQRILSDTYGSILVNMNGVKDSVAPYLNACSPLKSALMKADQDKIYEGVVQFIQWYISQKHTYQP